MLPLGKTHKFSLFFAELDEKIMSFWLKRLKKQPWVSDMRYQNSVQLFTQYAATIKSARQLIVCLRYLEARNLFLQCTTLSGDKAVWGAKTKVRSFSSSKRFLHELYATSSKLVIVQLKV